MAHFAGLDISIEETAICVVDDQGAVFLQVSVITEPYAIAEALLPFAETLKRAGHEAGALSPWLQPELKALGVPAVCLETRNVRAAMSAQRNKTDANDALGLAHIMRTGLVQTGLCEERSGLSAAAAADPAPQPEAQISRPGEQHPPFAEELRHQARQGRARGLRPGRARRLRRRRPHRRAESSFVEVVVGDDRKAAECNSGAVIRIELPTARVSIAEAASPALVGAVLKALR